MFFFPSEAVQGLSYRRQRKSGHCRGSGAAVVNAGGGGACRSDSSINTSRAHRRQTGHRRSCHTAMHPPLWNPLTLSKSCPSRLHFPRDVSPPSPIRREWVASSGPPMGPDGAVALWKLRVRLQDFGRSVKFRGPFGKGHCLVAKKWVRGPNLNSALNSGSGQ